MQLMEYHGVPWCSMVLHENAHGVTPIMMSPPYRRAQRRQSFFSRARPLAAAVAGFKRNETSVVMARYGRPMLVVTFPFVT